MDINMVLNSEFWEALTGNQRRKFAKANCEATYKKAIQYQIFAAVLGMLGIGLFLPIADKARRYFKGYYSLREEEMPTAVKVLCIFDFVFGLFASIVLMFTSSGDDYGLFVNTMPRRKLEAMLNETDAVPTTVGVGGDDPFRITNFSDSVLKVHEPKPARRGCENFDAVWLVAINVAVIVLFTVLFSLLFSSCSSHDRDTDITPSVDTTSQVVSVEDPRPTVEDFGELTRYPSEIGDGVTMIVNASSGLKLRKGPTTKDEIIAQMPHKANVKVYNFDDVDKWFFVEYIKDGTPVYGWACERSGDDHYIIPVNNSVDSSSEGGDESSEAVSSVAEKTLSDAEVKKAVINHINAVNDAVNDFIGYLECNVNDTESAIVFGADGLDVPYYKVTNVKSASELKGYLSKYMITSLANKESEIPVVNDKNSVPEAPVVSYNGALYIMDPSNLTSTTVDTGSITVLSSSANAYVVSATAIDDTNTVLKLTINFQYKDDKFSVVSFSS